MIDLKENQLTTDPGLYSQARWTSHLFPQTSFPVQLCVRDSQEYYTMESNVCWNKGTRRIDDFSPPPCSARLTERFPLWRQTCFFPWFFVAKNLFLRVALTESNNLLQEMKTFSICVFLIPTVLGATFGSGNTNKEGMFCQSLKIITATLKERNKLPRAQNSIFWKLLLVLEGDAMKCLQALLFTALVSNFCSDFQSSSRKIHALIDRLFSSRLLVNLDMAEHVWLDDHFMDA